MNWSTIIVALVTFLGSAGLWTYIDHRQQRKADKESRDDEILSEIRSIRKEIEEIRTTIAENEAKTRRIRILRFADEVFTGREHTKDAFDQTMSDITDYELYCDEHPTFKNHQTEETIKFLNRIYNQRMEKKDFLSYKPQELKQAM